MSKRKRTRDRTGPRCMQCGKPATGTLLKDEVRTTWCDTHFPTVWQLNRHRSAKGHKAWERRFDAGLTDALPYTYG